MIVENGPSKKTRHNVVEVNHVSKKFCRNLQRSLRYGVVDLAREALGMNASQRLRPGEFYAVKDANFTIKQGECVALLGPNGAGKSTMLKMLNGLLKPNLGQIKIRGSVGALTQLGAGFNPILTGRENIFINGAVLGLNRKQVDARFHEIVEFSELGDKVETPVKNYSAGERARLGYSVAAFLRADLLLMDEVLATGDLRFKAKCFNHLDYLISQGTSIIIVAHALGRLSRICKRAIVFSEHGTAFDGPMDEGIAVYHKLLNIEELMLDEDDTSSENVRGTVAWVESVEIVDEEGKELTEVHHGETMRVRLTLNSSEKVVGARLFVGISSTGGVVGGTVSDRNAFRLKGQAKTVEVVFPDLKLLQGTYVINVKLTGRNTRDIYHFTKGAAVLRVRSENRGGLIALDHQWSY
jgi:lipopolysaccharide transport system ATP-binding protein